MYLVENARAVSARALASPWPLYRDTDPIEGFRCRVRLRVLVDDLPEPPLSFVECAALKRDPGKPELQLREEVVDRQKSLDPVALDAILVQDEHRRRPLHVQLLTHTGIDVAGIAYVDANGNEFKRDEPHDPLVGVHLGFQPSTAASHRGRGEVDERALLVLLRLAQCPFGVTPPGDSFFSHCRTLQNSAVSSYRPHVARADRRSTTGTMQGR